MLARPVEALPYDQMWLDDVYWFPLALRGTPFRGYFAFGDHSTLLSHRVDVLPDARQLDAVRPVDTPYDSSRPE
jgi:hypothetical protein